MRRHWCSAIFFFDLTHCTSYSLLPIGTRWQCFALRRNEARAVLGEKALRRGDKEESAAVERKPIRGTFFACCASANSPAVIRRIVTKHRSILFFSRSASTAMDMPQNEGYENH